MFSISKNSADLNGDRKLLSRDLILSSFSWGSGLSRISAL